MRPEFDEKDAEILANSQLAFDKIQGPRVGDFVQLPGEEGFRRFTYEWDDGLQTTCTIGDASFYFNAGVISYSGSLDPVIALECLEDTGETREGNVWFFHHGYTQAHNGVYCKAKFRVYKATYNEYQVSVRIPNQNIGVELTWLHPDQERMYARGPKGAESARECELMSGISCLFRYRAHKKKIPFFKIGTDDHFG